MIKDQFLYFAQYPSKEGVRAILTNGASDFLVIMTLRSLSINFPMCRDSLR